MAQSSYTKKTTESTELWKIMWNCHVSEILIKRKKTENHPAILFYGLAFNGHKKALFACCCRRVFMQLLKH